MVRTRFAPSPTGYLHIGGVRTALFNWLYARRHNGQFILRIDDTDQQRNVAEALKPILDGFQWLGINWDEGPDVDGPHAPYYQSQRNERYQTAVQQLLNTGAAYHDYARPDEIQQQRETAQQENRSFVYDRRWMASDPGQRKEFESQGRDGVVRLKMPRDGKLVLNDLVRGTVEFEWAREQDHVIQRADGSCLYHLATVVDDHDFQISHVIRAEEHLSNTPRQAFIAEALGYPLPAYAHLPYVAEPGSKNKLSKRKLDKYLKNRDFAQLNQRGLAIASAISLTTSSDTFNPVIVDFYQEVGFLAEAIVNYLLLLGWSLDDKTEFFSREEMVAHFSLERVNKAPASFDPQKLVAFQEHYMRQRPIKQKTAMALPFLRKAGLVESPTPCEMGPKLKSIIEGAGDRIVVAGDILDYGHFFMADDGIEFEEKAFDKRLRSSPDSVELLSQFRSKLAEVDSFDAATLERVLKDFVQSMEIKIGQIIHALRVAVTGSSVGFGMFDTLEILGKDACLARIDRAIRLASE